MRKRRTYRNKDSNALSFDHNYETKYLHRRDVDDNDEHKDNKTKMKIVEDSNNLVELMAIRNQNHRVECEQMLVMMD